MATAAARRARVCFVCSQCGVAAPKWQGRGDGCGARDTRGGGGAAPEWRGRCDGGGAWNTVVEEVVRLAASGGGAAGLVGARPLTLAEAQAEGPATRLQSRGARGDRV